MYLSTIKITIMRIYITVPNEDSQRVELILTTWNWIHDVETIRERDFYTDFIFTELTEEEEDEVRRLITI